jgi:hypothetical protein
MAASPKTPLFLTAPATTQSLSLSMDVCSPVNINMEEDGKSSTAAGGNVLHQRPSPSRTPSHMSHTLTLPIKPNTSGLLSAKKSEKELDDIRK